MIKRDDIPRISPTRMQQMITVYGMFGTPSEFLPWQSLIDRAVHLLDFDGIEEELHHVFRPLN